MSENATIGFKNRFTLTFSSLAVGVDPSTLTKTADGDVTGERTSGIQLVSFVVDFHEHDMQIACPRWVSEASVVETLAFAVAKISASLLNQPSTDSTGTHWEDMLADEEKREQGEPDAGA